MNSRLVPLIALVVVATDAVLLVTGTIGPAVALALFLIVEIPLGALAVTGYVRRYRAHRARTETHREALRALAADDPYLRLGAAEARTVASLARWVTRRPDVPVGAVPIGYARGTLGMPIALAVAATIELVAVHLLVPWPVVRLVLDLLGIYGLLMVLGWLAGRIVRPHVLDRDVLTLRSGPHVCARIPLAVVTDARRERRLSPTNAEITGDDDCGVALVLPGPDGTNLSLTLAQPVAASVPDFGWRAPTLRQVSVVRLQVDDPGAAVRAVRSETRAPTAS
ncbi:hypothetical protein [Dietzia cinnamea]|uniref:Uncharacterized protein n=1 Tax=Dietzia cinnamea TaxID=321318 RepID=A0AAW5Q4X7_9ACTN|nr:hypothetical protein [Dietzia cinnamea]PWD95764.1 hypothetical protein DEQ16_08845 [Dietzia maris]MBM7231458.1 hypothetical protein [Dietzia cinnamea]MCT1865148.1 hypothetical protein [Dietzia cinnamea]MCT2031119.1 hypothetical protein [Dietzia cinnamea]MCT2034671.1 hypothetical protein [Dietzia cinnamea]